MQASLHFIPKVFNWVQIRAEGRPWHDADVVLLEDGHGSSGNMRTSVVLLKSVLTMLSKKRNNVGSDDLVNIPLCCDAVSSTMTNILKAHGSKSRIKSNASPDHNARTTPLIPFVCFIKTGTWSTPNPDFPSACETQKRLSSDNALVAEQDNVLVDDIGDCENGAGGVLCLC